MFSQIFMAAIAVLLFYIGVVDGSIFNIIIATLLIIVSVSRFYAAKSGSSFREAFDKWRMKYNKKTNGE
jgi:phosphatidylglycerophosphate synthase